MSEIAAQSGVAVEVEPARIPLFDGVRELLSQGVISGANEKNRDFSSAFADRSPSVPDDLEAVLYDPQTSGGLLMCVDPNRAAAVLARLRERGVSSAAVIGRVLETSGAGRIRLV